jgi:hypothetical protein
VCRRGECDTDGFGSCPRAIREAVFHSIGSKPSFYLCRVHGFVFRFGNPRINGIQWIVLLSVGVFSTHHTCGCDRKTAGVDDVNVVEVKWNGPFGTIVHVAVNRASVISAGELIISVDCHPFQQQLALARTIDTLAWMCPNVHSGAINARFQMLVERLVTGLGGTESRLKNANTLESCTDLERLARDFTETARTYGRVIISELHLPIESKTVRPINVGGVLGGAKFLVRGVLFKVATSNDTFASYPDPIYIANKVQGHN